MSDRLFNRIMAVIFAAMGLVVFIAMIEGGRALACLLLAIAEK